MRKNKKSISFIVVLLVAFLGIGYAYLTTTLSINGVTDVDSNTWDVHWNNVQVTSGSVTGDLVTEEPEIDVNGTTVTYHVRLSKPGDFYEFTIDAVNAGTIDAMIDSFEYTECIFENDCYTNDWGWDDYPLYTTFTYEDDTPILKKQLLSAGETEIIKVRIEYLADINADRLFNSNMSFDHKFKINYVQATNDAVRIRRYIYTTSNLRFVTEEPIPENAVYYENYQDAIDDFGHDIFIRHWITGNIVKKSDVGFINNNNLYYLRGGEGGAYYEENKSILNEAFGAQNCAYDDFYDLYYCDALVRATRVFPTAVTPNGSIQISAENASCGIRGDQEVPTYAESECSS